MAASLTWFKGMFGAVLQEMDGAIVKGVPLLIAAWQWHRHAPLISNTTLTT